MECSPIPSSASHPVRLSDEALERLLSEVRSDLLRVYERHRIAPDLAEDLAQDALERIWKGLPRLKDPARLQAWCRCIGMNLLRNHFARSRELQALPEGERVGARDPLREALRSEARRQLAGAASGMARRQFEVVLKRVFEGRSAEETSEALGIPRERLKRVLYRGLERMRERFSEADREALVALFAGS